MSTYHYRRPHAHTAQAYRCGAMTGLATTAVANVTCGDCKHLLERGVGQPTPRLTKPPYMNDEDDGMFVFYDVDYDERVASNLTMEVVPQATGNVEITIGGPDGHLFTLNHLDRADLIRALLHDFHYSPERGGPHDH